MPSVLIGNQSGGQQLFSGWPYSGSWPVVVGGVQLRWDRLASGNAYVTFSGGITIGSGCFLRSGGASGIGYMDGLILGPGDDYFVPKIALQTTGPYSGQPWNIYLACDQAASGQGRMYWDVL